MKTFFVFDVESIGLHGEAFAVAGGVYDETGLALREFCYSCPREKCVGNDADREWVNANIPPIEVTHQEPVEMRHDFWGQWNAARHGGSQMWAECGWPVEANFLAQCVRDDDERIWTYPGPYPFHEIATAMLCAGMDPHATYARYENELPAHNPLCDARQSARLLMRALLVLPDFLSQADRAASVFTK